MSTDRPIDMTGVSPHAGGPALGPPTAAPPGADDVDPQLVQATRNQIRSLVQEISALAQSNVGVDEFYDEFLKRVVSALASVGGAIWTVSESGLRLRYQANLPAVLRDEQSAESRRHVLLLRKILADGKPVLAPPRSGSGDDEEAANPTEQLLVVGMVSVEGEALELVEVFQRPSGGPTTQRGYLRFLTQMCDLASGFLTRRRLQQYSDRHTEWKSLEAFVQAAHSALDSRKTAYTVANEARCLLECDRVSVVLQRGRDCRVEAISGLDSLDRRAQEVAALENLVKRVTAVGRPLWRRDERGEPLPPQLEEALDEYLDLSHSKLLAIEPLMAGGDESADEGRAEPNRPQPIGALIVEQMKDSRAGAEWESKVKSVANHAAAAIANSLEHESLFLLPLWKALGRAKWLVSLRNLPKTVAVMIVLATAITALAVIPAELKVSCRGVLQPVERREVFAQIDGIVYEAPVRHAQRVKTKDVLIRMRNTGLEDQVVKLVGEVLSTQQQYDSRRAALIKNDRLTPLEQERLDGEVRQLRAALLNARERLDLVRRKQRELTIRSDRDAQVVSWRVGEKLINRPVKRGDSLLSLVDPDGEWELELRMSEDDIGYVDAARRASEDAPLEVSFLLTTHPDREFTGELIEVQRTADVGAAEEGNTVRLRVRIRKQDLPELRNEATVVAQVHCGRRSLGFVWFHDLIETLQKNWLLWF